MSLSPSPPPPDTSAALTGSTTLTFKLPSRRSSTLLADGGLADLYATPPFLQCIIVTFEQVQNIRRQGVDDRREGRRRPCGRHADGQQLLRGACSSLGHSSCRPRIRDEITAITRPGESSSAPCASLCFPLTHCSSSTQSWVPSCRVWLRCSCTAAATPPSFLAAAATSCFKAPITPCSARYSGSQALRLQNI